VKKCIWCFKNESEVKFNNVAHTIPQTLGGKDLCINVCDGCNSYFGSYNNKLPPIDTVLKETFNVSRARFLEAHGQIGKNKLMSHFSSTYFKINFKQHKIELKPQFKFHSHFQDKICRQMKKGLFKIYLEETERKFGNGHDSKFDFIREFARYNIGDYPIFYFERLYGMIVIPNGYIEHPELIPDYEYLVNEAGFYEFEFFGHVFGIPIIRNWHLVFENYKRKTLEAKKKFFPKMKLVKNFNDVDLTLHILND
jgi:hypothetical protein